MKIFSPTLVLAGCVGLCTYASSAYSLVLHITRSMGLMPDEHQLIRTDIKVWTDGSISQTGY
jgi:hypothetical protein